MESKLKVMIVSANPSLKGGTNRAMVNMVWALADDHDFTLLALGGSESIYPLPPRVQLISFDQTRTGPLGRAIKTLLLVFRLPQLLRILAERRPDVVLSLLPRPNIVNVLLKRLSGLDYVCVVCERNFTSVQLGHGILNRLLRRLVQAAYRRADLVVANAHALAQDLARSYRIPPQMILTVYNPIDIKAIESLAAEDLPPRPFSSDAPVLLTVGRLIPQKNHDLLIRSFARARRELTCKLAIIGEGPLLARSQRLAATLDVADDVLFLGWQDNPFRYMKRATAFVLSSNHEGFPNVLVEAMASGCPVISTDCPSGPREILESGEAGILVPFKDESALAEAMVRVLSDPQLQADLARRGHIRARAFDLPAVIDSYRSIFKRQCA